MMADAVERAIMLGYEIQHIFVSEIADGKSAEARKAIAFLQSVEFDLDARGNQIALLRSAETRDAIRTAPQSIIDAFRAAGFGVNIQNSINNPNAHPNYNEFNIAALNELASRADIES